LATKSVTLPSLSKNRVPVTVRPWWVKVTRAELSSTASKETLSVRKADGNQIISLAVERPPGVPRRLAKLRP
jgi:hypothetical protein